MKKGDKVHWNWGKSQAEGTIKENLKRQLLKNKRYRSKTKGKQRRACIYN